MKNIKNKNYLMVCELHHPEIHGKTKYSDPNIETHYLVYDRFDPITGISYKELEQYLEYDTDEEYGSESDDTFEENKLLKTDDEILFLRKNYSKLLKFNRLNPHPSIRNYINIISNKTYIKLEIGEYVILPTQESVAILKTFWLRIIQKKWKKICQTRKKNSLNLIGLRGMLSSLKNVSYVNKKSAFQAT